MWQRSGGASQMRALAGAGRGAPAQSKKRLSRSGLAALSFRWRVGISHDFAAVLDFDDPVDLHRGWAAAGFLANLRDVVLRLAIRRHRFVFFDGGGPRVIGRECELF